MTNEVNCLENLCHFGIKTINEVTQEMLPTSSQSYPPFSEAILMSPNIFGAKIIKVTSFGLFTSFIWSYGFHEIFPRSSSADTLRAG